MPVIMNESLVSALILTDLGTPRHDFKPLVPDGMFWEDLSLVSGDTWEAWAFNGPKFEPSVYSGFAFNSYAVEDGVTYAAREEGIFILGGTKDAGADIHDGVILSPSLFGGNSLKRFRAGVFDITGTAPVVRAEVGGVGSSIPILRSKAFFPRSLKGQKWTFLIAEFDELGRTELFPTVLNR